jgi:hypothetical protein
MLRTKNAKASINRGFLNNGVADGVRLHACHSLIVRVHLRRPLTGWQARPFEPHARAKLLARSATNAKASINQGFLNNGVADGVRTHDNWNHNPGLYR